MNDDLIRQITTILTTDYAGDRDKMFTDLNAAIDKAQIQHQVSAKSFDATGKRKVIELKNVSKIYKLASETINAIKDITLDIYEGEMIAIVGPSGSGKSTLLQLTGALDKPSEGTLLVDGQDISKLNDKQLSTFRNKTIGFVFQSFYLQSYLNIQQNVEIPLLFGGMKKSDRRVLSEEATESVGLKERIKHLPKQLSGGQMQRVAIARALVNKPKIILADEPTANLDKQTTIDIMELLRTLNEKLGTTVIIVTHNELVADYCQRQIKLSNGELA